MWWWAGAATWRDIAVSVPDLSEFPDGPVPGQIAAMQYPSNSFCLDCSAALDGPLVCYRHEQGAPIDPANIVVQHR